MKDGKVVDSEAKKADRCGISCFWCFSKWQLSPVIFCCFKKTD